MAGTPGRQTPLTPFPLPNTTRSGINTDARTWPSSSTDT